MLKVSSTEEAGGCFKRERQRPVQTRPEERQGRTGRREQEEEKEKGRKDKEEDGRIWQGRWRSGQKEEEECRQGEDKEEENSQIWQGRWRIVNTQLRVRVRATAQRRRSQGSMPPLPWRVRVGDYEDSPVVISVKHITTYKIIIQLSVKSCINKEVLVTIKEKEGRRRSILPVCVTYVDSYINNF